MRVLHPERQQSDPLAAPHRVATCRSRVGKAHLELGSLASCELSTLKAGRTHSARDPSSVRELVVPRPHDRAGKGRRGRTRKGKRYDRLVPTQEERERKQALNVLERLGYT
jgi:hypothetical protein